MSFPECRVEFADGSVVSTRGPMSYAEFNLKDTGATLREYQVGEPRINCWHDVNTRDGQGSLRERALEAKLLATKQDTGFRNAIANLCAIAHLPFDPNDAETTVQNLIQWSIQVATDPAVLPQN